jgi:surface antigen
MEMSAGFKVFKGLIGYKRAILAPVLLAQLIYSVPAHANRGADFWGAIIGGGAGAGICRGLSGGMRNGDRNVLTLGCGLLGAGIGYMIGSRKMAEDDERAMYESYPRVLDAPPGHRVPWEGREFEGYHEVIETGYYRNHQTTHCSRVQTVIVEHHRYGRNTERVTTTETTTVCRFGNEWRRVEVQDVVMMPPQRPAPPPHVGGGRPGQGYPDASNDPRYPGRTPMPPPPVYGMREISWQALDPYLARLEHPGGDERYRLSVAAHLRDRLHRTGETLNSNHLGMVLSYFYSARARARVNSMLIPYLNNQSSGRY